MNEQDTLRMYRYREVLDLLGISRTTLYQLVRSGKLRTTTIGKSGKRIRGSEIKRYLDANTPGTDGLQDWG